MSTQDTVFDEVVIRDCDGEHKLSRADFIALPLTTRVKHLLSGGVRFRRSGVDVDPKRALQSI